MINLPMSQSPSPWVLVRLLMVAASLLTPTIFVPTQANATTAAVPSTLVGQWSTLGTSVGGYYNTATGTWTSAGGHGVVYELRGNGTYVFSGYMESHAYGCGMNLFIYQAGIMAVQGARMMLKATQGLKKVEYSCNPAQNYERAYLRAPEIYQWRLQEQDGAHQLILHDDTGNLVLKSAP